MKKMTFVIIALIFFSCCYSYSQSQQTEQTMKTDIKQEERIVDLEKDPRSCEFVARSKLNNNNLFTRVCSSFYGKTLLILRF